MGCWQESRRQGARKRDPADWGCWMCSPFRKTTLSDDDDDCFTKDSYYFTSTTLERLKGIPGAVVSTGCSWGFRQGCLDTRGHWVRPCPCCGSTVPKEGVPSLWPVQDAGTGWWRDPSVFAPHQTDFQPLSTVLELFFLHAALPLPPCATPSSMALQLVLPKPQALPFCFCCILSWLFWTFPPVLWELLEF